MPVTRRRVVEIVYANPADRWLWTTWANVTATALRVLQDALHLTPTERAELIDGRLHSFDPSPDQRQVDAWKAEAESRIDAFEAGLLTGDSAEAMFERINRR
jgi:putative addiction module component (TIGR02574 family)